VGLADTQQLPAGVLGWPGQDLGRNDSLKPVQDSDLGCLAWFIFVISWLLAGLRLDRELDDEVFIRSFDVLLCLTGKLDWLMGAATSRRRKRHTQRHQQQVAQSDGSGVAN
jgi:hypothetical protein